MDLGTGCYIDAIISVSSRNGEVFFEFCDSEKEVFIVDQMDSFQILEFSENDPLKLVLNGEKSSRSFKFLQESALTNVLDFLHNFYTLKVVPGSKKQFSIMPIASFKKCRTSKAPNRSNSQPSVRIGYTEKSEGLTSGLIRESISEIELKIIDRNNYKDYIIGNHWKNNVKIYEFEIDQSFAFTLWLILANVEFSEESLSVYDNLYIQIDEFHKYEWDHSPELRSYVRSIETDISKRNFRISCMKKIVHDVLLCMFAQKLYSIVFSHSLVDICVFFVDNLISADMGNGYIMCQNGEKLSIKEVSAKVFLLFEQYFSRSIDSLDRLYQETMELLLDASPTTHALLADYSVSDFVFLKDFIHEYFINERSNDESTLLFTAAFASQSLFSFFKHFIAESFILLHSRLSQTPMEQKNLFQSYYLGLLSSVNIRLLLFNTHLMQDFEADSV